ncbi:hypothetical protein AKJ09_03728 [Labilithrix luteola]|uniref:Uncharacterized protein n=1 Tax=Labilithrix luteola TaxID=1391654 RepID=A0A0K1PVB0_9BACT|nr:hypothetical protein AKJ09_03728 [Labilithrix luteola]
MPLYEKNRAHAVFEHGRRRHRITKRSESLSSSALAIQRRVRVHPSLPSPRRLRRQSRRCF